MTDLIEGLTPRAIVEELDRYIVGQAKAKRAVAIALRDRFRRKRLPDEIRDEVIPKNILMIGPTGVGKTEVARRLASLANAPFVKVEASKFTEVGYVGRDVESMVRDLVQVAHRMVETEMMAGVEDRAREAAMSRIVDQLEPLPRKEPSQSDLISSMAQVFGQSGFGPGGFGQAGPNPGTRSGSREGSSAEDERWQTQVSRKERLRERLRREIESGERDLQTIEIEVEEQSPVSLQTVGAGSIEDMTSMLKDAFGGMLGRKRTRTVTIGEARRILAEEEARKLLDPDEVRRRAVERAEQTGIIFVDEIDKIAGGRGMQGPDVSREGVQRDILPIIEGSTVSTRLGSVRTDHILFIAAGAFHVSKPSDLIPELQGRLPIRVELDSLTQADFRRILTEPRNALVKQYSALLGAEGVYLRFEEEAIDEISQMAFKVNETTENIGARRLHTLMERLLDQISFDAPDLSGQEIRITRLDVQQRLGDLVQDQDRSRYIL